MKTNENPLMYFVIARTDKYKSRYRLFMEYKDSKFYIPRVYKNYMDKNYKDDDDNGDVSLATICDLFIIDEFGLRISRKSFSSIPNEIEQNIYTYTDDDGTEINVFIRRLEDLQPFGDMLGFFDIDDGEDTYPMSKKYVDIDVSVIPDLDEKDAKIIEFAKQHIPKTVYNYIVTPFNDKKMTIEPNIRIDDLDEKESEEK